MSFSVWYTISKGWDNKGAVDKLNWLQIPVGPDIHHFNFLQNIQQISKDMSNEILLLLDKGSQDNNNDVHELSREVYLNVLAD